MRRADRLFQIIQILRRARSPVRAVAIAEELETSLRTIYRDVAQLIADRVPIRGEAGVGYVLEGGFDMPPLMLTPDEIEAAMLGAQWVRDRADPQLARAAADLVAKIAAVIPDHLRPILLEPTVAAPSRGANIADTIDMGRLRTAMRKQEKVALLYRDEEGRLTRRTVWPVAMSYWERARVLVAWCELRNGFRHFRTDRVVDSEFLAQRYPTQRSRLRASWLKEMREHCDTRRSRASQAMEVLVE